MKPFRPRCCKVVKFDLISNSIFLMIVLNVTDIIFRLRLEMILMRLNETEIVKYKHSKKAKTLNNI